MLEALNKDALEDSELALYLMCMRRWRVRPDETLWSTNTPASLEVASATR